MAAEVAEGMGFERLQLLNHVDVVVNVDAGAA